jgi:hypothetical protein
MHAQPVSFRSTLILLAREGVNISMLKQRMHIVHSNSEASSGINLNTSYIVKTAWALLSNKMLVISL